MTKIRCELLALWDWGLKVLLLLSCLGPIDMPACSVVFHFKTNISLSIGCHELQCSFTSKIYTHLIIVIVQLSTVMWNLQLLIIKALEHLLSHLLHNGIDMLHITSGIWLLPCLSSLLIHLSPLPWKLESRSAGEGILLCAVLKVLW